MYVLTDRTVLVTGGASAVGAALCRQLVRAGARVLVADGCHAVAEGTRLADSLGHQARFELLDTSSEREWTATLNDGVGRFGALDVLVLVEPDAVAVALALRTAGRYLARRGGAAVGIARREQAEMLGLGGIPVVELPDGPVSAEMAERLAQVAVRYVRHGLRASVPRPASSDRGPRQGAASRR
jgi:NAD(P)-dependent dehydrogenase (short-subunit alcohol dehydrogenase family)